MQWEDTLGLLQIQSAIQCQNAESIQRTCYVVPKNSNDRMLFAAEWRSMLEQTPNLDFFQDMVKSLI